MPDPYSPRSTRTDICTHRPRTGTVDLGNRNYLYASRRTCGLPLCIANGARWVAKKTGMSVQNAQYRVNGGSRPALSYARDFANRISKTFGTPEDAAGTLPASPYTDDEPTL